MSPPFEWSWYTWFWIVWLTVALSTFGVVEVIALMDPRPHDTLTETLVAYARTHPVRSFLVLGFCAWLLVHFARRIL